MATGPGGSEQAPAGTATRAKTPDFRKQVECEPADAAVEETAGEKLWAEIFA
jgi:hypothetical protein